MVKSILFSLFSLCVALVQADEIGTSYNNISDLNNGTDLKKVQIEASLLNFQYMSAAKNEASTQQHGQIDIQYSKEELIEYKFHGSVGSFGEQKSSFVTIPEAYLSFNQIDPRNYLAFGRKIDQFSFADQQQNLGLYHSYYTNDFLNYQQQGLVGIHFGMHQNNFGFKGGFYPFYLPNQGPQIYEESGEIKTSNRWAKQPPKLFSFADQNHQIQYTIRNYKIADIVQHDGYAGSFYFGADANRPLVQVSYARKPISEILISRDTYATAEDFLGQVKLSPVVGYSQTQSVEFNLDTDIIETTFSYLEDHPENQMASENEALQSLESIQMVSIWGAVNLQKFLNYPIIVEASIAEISGGKIQELMSDGSASIFAFANSRTIFRRPVSLAFKSDFFSILNKPVTTTAKWIYDREFKGTVFSGKFDYQPIEKVGVQVGFDVLGVENENSSNSNFIQDNQANDRFYGGLQYVF